MQKALVYHNGHLIKTYEFDNSKISIGRLPTNDISISSMSISRNHLNIEYNPQVGAFVALDHQSLNGTLLNGTKIEQNTPIPSDSQLVIGQYSVHLEYTESNPNTTPQVNTAVNAVNPSDVSATTTVQNQSLPEMTSEGTGTAGLYFGAADTGAKRGQVSASASGIIIEQSTKMEHSITKKEITFGNGQNDDIFVDEGKLAKISVIGKQHEIKALKVMGKIVVNDKKVGQHILQDGDIFRVGKNSFVFKAV